MGKTIFVEKNCENSHICKKQHWKMLFFLISENSSFLSAMKPACTTWEELSMLLRTVTIYSIFEKKTVYTLPPAIQSQNKMNGVF